MATTGLIDFTTPYTGGPSFYTSNGTTSLVPSVYPIAIGGRAYMIDVKSQRFGRGFEARVRDSVDQGNIPGEASINPQGLWRRAQVSWHKGSGQVFADSGSPLDYRFNTSKGLDCWTKNELRLLPDTSQVLSSASTNLKMVVAGGRLYVADGNTLKYTTNLSSFTTVTGTPAAAINGMATDGYTVYVAYEGNGIYSTATDSSAAASWATGHNWGELAFVKGRLFAGGAGATNQYRLWNITAGGNNPPITYSNANTAFLWNCFAAGQNAIYAGGYSGKTSLIYKITVKSDGTLDTPVVAAELPIGEVIASMTGYLGYVLIGTNKGARLATADSNANLVIGPTLETSTDVKCAVGDSKYFWYGWTNFDSTSTGLGRLDLSELNGVNEPAYASDLMVTAQGAVNSVVNWDGTRIFSISGAGIYQQHATDLVSEGYMETGTWTWGVPDRKFLPRFDIRTEPLNGTITPYFKFDGGTYVAQGPDDTPGSTETTIPSEQTGFSEVAIKLVFARKSTDATVGPVLRRWQGRGFVAPIRSEVFSIPVLLHSKLNIRGREYYQDVQSELRFLQELVNDATITNYQEYNDSHEVIVENVEWVPVDSRGNTWDWEGTAIVTARSID